MAVARLPALVFEPDAYALDLPKLMGRQAAGHGFLRAAVASASGQEICCYTPHRESAEAFARLVTAFAPAAKPKWIQSYRLDQLAEVGALHQPDGNLADRARLRLRSRPDAYSITGVTHTTASLAAMDQIASLLTAPIMPWDALICTSSAVHAFAQNLLGPRRDYLRWRFGPIELGELEMPIIPLGVHCADFDATPDEKQAAKQALGFGPDDVVLLFVGRLSYHGKAHPFPLYAALQEVASRSSVPIGLIQCGWFVDSLREEVFKRGAQLHCPACSVHWTNGRDADERRRSWAAADIFVSLSDNLQETFGLTPVEAMAAGLPSIVTDWNGYADTIRDGLDGFRIPTWMPGPHFGDRYALRYEAAAMSYDEYIGLTSQLVSVDYAALTDRLTALVGSAGLRHTLGAAAQAQARSAFDWSTVFVAYRELFEGLRAVRIDAVRRGSGHASPPACFGSPFAIFSHYASELISERTRVACRADVDFLGLLRDPLFSYSRVQLPPDAILSGIVRAVSQQPGLDVAAIGARVGTGIGAATAAVAWLAKIGMFELRAAPPEAGATSRGEIL